MDVSEVLHEVCGDVAGIGPLILTLKMCVLFMLLRIVLTCFAVPILNQFCALDDEEVPLDIQLPKSPDPVSI